MIPSVEAFLEALPLLLKAIPGLAALISALLNDKGGSVEAEVRRILENDLAELEKAIERAKGVHE